MIRFMHVLSHTIGFIMCTHWVLFPVPPIQGQTPLTAACLYGRASEAHVPVVKMLLEAGAAVDKRDSSVRGYVHTATLFDDTEL
jgi:hypothetical protein